MEDRKRIGALGLVCVAVMVVCARPAAAGSAPLLQAAPLVYDAMVGHDLRARVVAPTPAFVAASPARRPVALIPLYGAFAALQAADVHSTTRALRQGGVEMNPLMGGVAGSPGGLVAVKLATTAAMIVATEQLWRSHPRAAVITMTIITSAYSAVVAHNYRVR